MRSVVWMALVGLVGTGAIASPSERLINPHDYPAVLGERAEQVWRKLIAPEVATRTLPEGDHPNCGDILIERDEEFPRVYQICREEWSKPTTIVLFTIRTSETKAWGILGVDGRWQAIPATVTPNGMISFDKKHQTKPSELEDLMTHFTPGEPGTHTGVGHAFDRIDLPPEINP